MPFRPHIMTNVTMCQRIDWDLELLMKTLFLALADLRHHIRSAKARFLTVQGFTITVYSSIYQYAFK